MDKKLVYVLVSKETDHYTEMAMLSIQCAKKYANNIRVELVMDSGTNASLTGYESTIKDFVSQVHVIDNTAQNNAYISRILKTKLRSYVTGDYLYVDVDAIPITNLDDVFNADCDIGMAYDLDRPIDMLHYMDHTNEFYTDGKWQLPDKYFNSGIMLCRDKTVVDDFFDNWHSTWQDYIKAGQHIDQPSLNEVIQHTDASVVELAPEWNVCIGRSTKSKGTKNPKIYHYFTINFDSRDDTHFINIVKNMKINQIIDWELINKVIYAKYPRTNHNSIRLQWMSGNYTKALKLLTKKFFSCLITQELQTPYHT